MHKAIKMDERLRIVVVIGAYREVTGAKRRNRFRLRHLRSAVNQVSRLGTNIAVTFCVFCDRLLFWTVSIIE